MSHFSAVTIEENYYMEARKYEIYFQVVKMLFFNTRNETHIFN